MARYNPCVRKFGLLQRWRWSLSLVHRVQQPVRRLMAESWFREVSPVAVDEDPVGTRQARRAELRTARRRQHEDRAERRRVQNATTPSEPSLASLAATARATGKPANLPTCRPSLGDIYSGRPAAVPRVHRAALSLGQDLGLRPRLLRGVPPQGCAAGQGAGVPALPGALGARVAGEVHRARRAGRGGDAKR